MKRGFTLAEVLITVAIISIMAGIMVPAIWKWWESQEVQTTKERMNALKLGMIGDKTLVQSGIRTSFGFVGDIGELPFGNSTTLNGLKYLVSNPDPAYPNWNGPYLSGFDNNTYAVDAWGRRFRYSTVKYTDSAGERYLAGEIRSAGLNGVFETDGDDIFVEISNKEVAPTYRIQGNFAFNTLSSSGSHSANFIVEYRRPDTSGELERVSSCKPAFQSFTTIFPNILNPENLPIGKITVKSQLYNNSNCTGTPFRYSDKFDYFVSDNMSRLLINLPATP